MLRVPSRVLMQGGVPYSFFKLTHYRLKAQLRHNQPNCAARIPEDQLCDDLSRAELDAQFLTKVTDDASLRRFARLTFAARKLPHASKRLARGHAWSQECTPHGTR